MNRSREYAGSLLQKAREDEQAMVLQNALARLGPNRDQDRVAGVFQAPSCPAASRIRGGCRLVREVLKEGGGGQAAAPKLIQAESFVG